MAMRWYFWIARTMLAKFEILKWESEGTYVDILLISTMEWQRLKIHLLLKLHTVTTNRNVWHPGMFNFVDIVRTNLIQSYI